MVAAKPKNDTPDVPSDDLGLDYIVVWGAVSVHLPDQDEPLKFVQGDTLPAEAIDQGPFLKSIGAVSVIARKRDPQG